MTVQFHFAPLIGDCYQYDETKELRADGPQAAMRAYAAVRHSVGGDAERVGCYIAIVDGGDVVDALGLHGSFAASLMDFLNHMDPTYRTPPVSVPHTQSTTQE